MDLAGAYTTAMAMCPDIDYSKPPHLLQGELSSAVINIHSIGFGYVKFSFPDDIMYPCLPVKDDKGRGLIYPLNGETYASAPEIYIALQLGAKISSINFTMPQIIPNSHSLLSTVQHFTQLRVDAKNLYGKGSPQELKYKEMGNSVYGKLGQGLKGKKTYSIKYDCSEEVGISLITNPILASHTTSLVRALLSACMAELYLAKEEIHSITTDGFITTANIDKMNSLSGGGYVALFLQARREATFDNSVQSIWEQKHFQNSFLNIKTRGNIGFTEDGVMAKAGYKFNKDIAKDNQRSDFIDLVLSRDGSVPMTYEQAPTAKDYIRKNSDGIFKSVTKHVNFDYDFKRKPVEYEDIETFYDGKNYNQVRFWTVPHYNIEEFEKWRCAKDNTPKAVISAEVVRLLEFKKQNSSSKVKVTDVKRTILNSILRMIRTGKLQNQVTISGKTSAIIEMVDTVLDMNMNKTQ